MRLALAELALDYAVVELQLGERHRDVLLLSPTGTVPVLVDDKVVIWESSIMLDYLDAKYAPGSLLAPDPEQQVVVRTMHAYSDKCVGPAMRDLVFEKRSRPESQWCRDVLEQSNLKWRECQAYLESQLSDTYFSGADFGAADCALAARCGVAQAYGAAVTAEVPQLHRWFEAVKSRRCWEAAYPASFITTTT